jgi:hypothetical protein
MNTPTENAFQELQSDNTIVFETIETKKVSYEYQFTDQIKEQFENWKLEILETTDIEPNENDILEYFKKLNIIGFSSYTAGGPNIEIKSIIVNLNK